MLFDIITNNGEIFNFVKEKYGGRIIVNDNFKLVNIPAGYSNDFVSDIQRFIAEKGISLEENGYILYNPDNMIVRASGIIR